MKALPLIGILIVVIALVAVGFVLLRPDTGSDPNTINENDELDLIDETAIDGNGQFIMLAPDDESAASDELVPNTGIIAEEPVTSAAPTAEGVQVSMTDTGFEPASISVTSGTTVTFVNNAQAAKWPASAVHPTHQSYPGSDIDKCGTAEEATIFDACRGIPTGGEYSFTFTQPGTWKYHDHLQAQQVGTITVQ